MGSTATLIINQFIKLLDKTVKELIFWRCFGKDYVLCESGHGISRRGRFKYINAWFNKNLGEVK